jgi:replication factor C large subunit
MAANSKNSKIKEVIKNSKMVEFYPLSPFSSYLLLQHLLTVEGRSLELDQKLILIEKSNGDIRSLLNLVQSKLQGDYESLKSISKVLSVEDCVNLFFSSETVSLTKKILIQSDILYLSPKFGSTPEERMRDIVYALFSSIVANEKKIPLIEMAKILDGLSQFDLYINKIYKNRNWHLLRYANDVLISKLFDITRWLPIKYSQYNIPFPLIGSIFIRGQSTRMVGKFLSKIFHTNSSDFGMFYFLPLLTILKDFDHTVLFFNTVDDAKLNEIILKEQERLYKR